MRFNKDKKCCSCGQRVGDDRLLFLLILKERLENRIALCFTVYAGCVAQMIAGDGGTAVDFGAVCGSVLGAFYLLKWKDVDGAMDIIKEKKKKIGF